MVDGSNDAEFRSDFRVAKVKDRFLCGLPVTEAATRTRATVTDTPIPYSLCPFPVLLKQGKPHRFFSL